MVQPVVEYNSNLIRQVTEENNEAAEQLLKSLKVSYSIIVPNKITTCSLYLEDLVTQQKFVVAVGQSEVFFEQNFDKAKGELFAYEVAVQKAREFIFQHIYLTSFLKGLVP